MLYSFNSIRSENKDFKNASNQLLSKDCKRFDIYLKDSDKLLLLNVKGLSIESLL